MFAGRFAGVGVGVYAGVYAGLYAGIDRINRDSPVRNRPKIVETFP